MLARCMKALTSFRLCTGDWFNKLDWTLQSNNFGVGLPVATKNKDNWGSKQPLLANPDLKPSPEQIEMAAAQFKELLGIRYSSPLFRLRSKEQVQKQLTFLNTGPQQVAILILKISIWLSIQGNLSSSCVSVS